MSTNELKRLRLNYRLLQPEVAKIAGLPLRTYQRYETEEGAIYKLPLLAACKLADFYAVSPVSLLGEEGQKKLTEGKGELPCIPAIYRKD